MKNSFRLLTLALLLCGSLSLSAQTATVVRNDYANATYTFTFGEVALGSQTIEGHAFDVVTLEGSAPSELLGRPALPIVTKVVEIPLCESVSAEVSNVQSIPLRSLKNPMLPVQPSPSKSDRAPRPLVMDSTAYASDGFYSQPKAWVEVMGVARDRNLAMLRLSPLSYNPVTGEMELVKSMTVTLSYRNADVEATTAMREKYYSPDFAAGNNLLSTLPAVKGVHRTAPLHYLIVAHSMFRGQLDEFVAWKKRQGFIVTVAYTDDPEVGTTSSAIAAYTKSFYTNATDELPAPTYLLLVGDHQQIPAFNSRCNYPASNHVTDLYFATWTSGDNLPDCYLGRFSARNAQELQPQVEKSIYYERYDFNAVTDDYLNRAVLIAGEDAGRTGDNAYVYADPAMDYVAKTYVNADHGFEDVRYYKNNTSYAPDGVTVSGCSRTSTTSSTLRSLYNEGYGWVNYTAHGYDNEWSTPSFTASNASAMTNTNRPSIMIGNCCLSGRFNTTYDACLGEALLRRGDKAGAVAYIGGTNSTYWPQDFCWEVGVRSNFSNTMNTGYDANRLGCYDRMFHTHGESYDLWHNTMGSMIYAGNKAAEEYSSSYSLYYWEIYELFGDPSLMPWLSVPGRMDVSSDDVIPVGSTEYVVSAAPRAYVALTTAENHDFVCAAYANVSTGVATLPVPGNLAPGTYELAVWAQGYRPFFKEVIVTVLDGPYLQVRDIVSTTGAVTPGSYNDFDVTVSNLGTQDAQYGTIRVTPQSAGVGCIYNEIYTGPVEAGSSVTLPNALHLYIPSDVEDGDAVSLSMTLEFGNAGQSSRNVNIVVTAPRLDVSDVRVSPILEGGAQSAVSMRVANNGSVGTDSLVLMLRHDYGLASQISGPVAMGVLAPGSSRVVTFYVTMVDSLPSGKLPFSLVSVAEDGDKVLTDILLRAGTGDDEDFESNGLSSFPWQNNNNPWSVTSQDKHSGTYCARSKSGLGNNSSSRLEISWISTVNDSIRFWYKVSSEEGYDKFTFSIDGSTKLEADGEVEWTRAVYPVRAGEHQFSFAYAKDGSRSEGSDCAYVDDITFPFTGTELAFFADTACQGAPYAFGGQTISTSEIGTHHFSNAAGDSLLALTVAPSPEVFIESSGNVNCGSAVVLIAHGASRYEWNTGATGDVLVDYPQATTTYTVTGYTGTCSDQASITINVGIDETGTSAPVSVYPNPARESVVVVADGMRSVSLTNQLGQEVLRQEVSSSQARLDIRDLPTGVYFIKVRQSDLVSVVKLLKK